jgi:CDP-glucose 4,6-dehydratase
MKALENFYRGKKVLVTGHTGFKGAWLCWVLVRLGAKVIGYALPPEDVRGNLYKQTSLADEIKSVEADLKDRAVLERLFKEEKPEIVFHLAAQPIVLSSYDDPVETYETNAMGTVHLLEAARGCDSVRNIIIITTDKCYENREWDWPYRETDALGGYDPYSSSKAMAEIASSAYYRSFFKEKKVGVATARAGNVIGGGDFAPYRIIPDIVESIIKNEAVVLRHPDSIRPWQHVLDALYGYLLLGLHLNTAPEKFSRAYNFSPADADNSFTVERITRYFIDTLGQGEYRIDEETRRGHEAKLLRLDSSRARQDLGWAPHYTIERALAVTAEWYKDYVHDGNARQKTMDQINTYLHQVADMKEARQNAA